MFARFLIAAPIALAVSAAFIGAAATPAVAGETNCATTPAQLRGAAATADAATQRKALMLISTGERLCAADADREAEKKFAAAARALGTDVAALPATTAAR